MRRFLVAAAIGLVALAACESQTVIDQPSASGSEITDDGLIEKPGETKKTAALGDSIDLRGQSEGERMRVTVIELVDPAPSKDDIFTPEAGNKFVAVQIRLENIGSEVYSDSPTNGAVIIDTEDQQFRATFEDTSAGPGFGGSATITVGDKRVGYITFEMPASAKPRIFQFTLSSGFAPETGEWTTT
jgi:hypothetical protein